MAYFWLNQRDSQGYSDKEGEVYHYRDSVSGYRKLSEGDWFIYYMAGEYVLFGAGRIGSIRSEIDSKLTNYYADIDIYCPFDPPVSAREIKQDISFLQGKEGLNGVPQNSIYQIERKDYLKILESAGELDLLSTE